MATRELIINYSQYVIGRVESNWDWASCPAFDGVSSIWSIGMMQNAGSNAADLLQIIHDNYPEEWSDLETNAPRVANIVLTVPHTWGNYVNSFFTDSERVVVSRVISTDNGKLAQTQKWQDDAGAMIDYALSVGFSLDYPKQLIYFMSMYHQSPQGANQVVSSCGADATLLYLHDTCRNVGVLSNSLYNNRYNTVYSMLNDWDGASEPPDFGQVTDPSTGGQTPSPGQQANQITYMLATGNNFVIYGSDIFKDGLIMYPATGGRYIPSRNASGTSVDPGHVGGGDNTSANAVVDLVVSWEGQFAYSQAAGRLDPVNSGYGDCSSILWRAYWDVTGVDVGTWTGDMINKGTLIASGRYGSVDESILQPGDLLIIDWAGGNGFAANGHVEMYIGNGQLTGHGGPGYGPTRKADMQAYISTCPNWQIRRYV